MVSLRLNTPAVGRPLPARHPGPGEAGSSHAFRDHGQNITDQGPNIDVVLPCLNEAAALPRVLAGLPDTFRPIVVDNGSTDGSAAIAHALGAILVFEPRTGFGWAAHAGLLAATPEYVAFCDCDGSMGGEDLLRVAAPVLAGRTDLMLGRRRPACGSWAFHARLANAIVARRLRRRLNINIHDFGAIRLAPRQRLPRTGRSKVTGCIFGSGVSGK